MSHLHVENLSKRYSGSADEALVNFSIDIESGEIICLVGASGSGKSTALRLIAGFEEPDSGVIKVDDRAIYSDKVFVEPEKRGIGMIFQDSSLFPHLTVEKNIAFGLSKLSRSERKARVAEMLELVGLSDFAKRYPHQLSGGQQQRVALARAVAIKPSLILFDEAFSNLDEGLKESLILEVREILHKEKMTAIMVTHSTIDALNLADRIIVLKEGHMQQCDAPNQIYSCPGNTYVAKFFGKSNIFNAVTTSNGVDSDIGFLNVDHKLAEGKQVKVCIQPQFIDARQECVNAKCPGICSTVSAIRFAEGSKELLLKVKDSEVSVRMNVTEEFKVEENDTLHFKPQMDKIQILTS